jgi:ferritin-like metal-binding protein YciE
MADTMDDLLVEGLQEIYHVEQELVDALDTLAEETGHEGASQAFSEHREETQQQVDRLEEVFEDVGAEAETKEDAPAAALIEEHDSFAEENDGDVLDRYNIEAGQKTEHYEIAAYGSLTSLAGRLGHEDAAEKLEESLREEEEALDELSQVGDDFDESTVAAN